MVATGRHGQGRRREAEMNNDALVLHPLLFELGVFGIGMLTVALVLPWLLNAARPR